MFLKSFLKVIKICKKNTFVGGQIGLSSSTEIFLLIPCIDFSSIPVN